MYDHRAEAAFHSCKGRLSGHSLTSGRYVREGGREPLHVRYSKRAEQGRDSYKTEMGVENGKKRDGESGDVEKEGLSSFLCIGS